MQPLLDSQQPRPKSSGLLYLMRDTLQELVYRAPFRDVGKLWQRLVETRTEFQQDDWYQKS